jgi:hypothetical protein
MISSDKLQEVFLQIIGNKDDAKAAILDPSAVFIKYGIAIDDPEGVNAIFYDANPDLKRHFLAAVAGQSPDKVMEKCNSVGCLTCKAGLTITAGPFIMFYLGGSSIASAIVGIALACGMTELLVEGILASASGYDDILEKLCAAMGAC